MAVITISRQFGAGGRTLGSMVARELGYTFADSEIIQMVAQAANVSPHWVETVEREAGTRLSKVISSLITKSIVDRVLKNEKGYIDEKLYLDYLVVIIAQIAEEGNVVILGKGSQYILDDHPDAYHFLLINDRENRIRFLMDRYDMTDRRASAMVDNEDRRRVNFYRKLSKKDYDNPSLYHLVFNMAKISLDDAMHQILHLVRKS